MTKGIFSKVKAYKIILPHQHHYGPYAVKKYLIIYYQLHFFRGVRAFRGVNLSILVSLKVSYFVSPSLRIIRRFRYESSCKFHNGIILQLELSKC